MAEHQPVLLDEVIEWLNINPDGLYVDGTFGRGGHTRAILKHLSPQGRVIAIDQDSEAITYAKEQLGGDERLILKQGSFADLMKITTALNMQGIVDGILLDLGVSSPQLDDARRGFSFLRDGPLDMRMDATQGQTAAEWIQRVDEKTLAFVLKEYGEERFAKHLARVIVREREKEDITTTKQLADLIEKSMPRKERYKHAATRSFQAIRIFINRELEVLESCLAQSLEVLKIGGRLVVISFHSLEDRIVKQFIQQYERDNRLPADFPVREETLKPRLKRISKAIKAGEKEVSENIRARSATLRIAEKLG